MKEEQSSDQPNKAISIVEYLDHLVDSGQAPRGAIRHLKTAFTKVLSTVKGRQWYDVDVDTIALDEYMDSFKKLTDISYTPGSLATYKQRIEKVLDWYSRVRKDPTWSPYLQSITQKPSKPTNYITKPHLTTTAISMTEGNGGLYMLDAMQQPKLITYPFPLSNGVFVEIKLPLRLSRHDAKRISNFIYSIATDQDKMTEAKM